MKCPNSFYALLSTTPTFLITPQTTPSICKANYSPLSSENHRSLFVKPAKRGKQRAGGEALFALHYFTLHYQRHHHSKLTAKLLPPFARLITPLSLRRGAGGEALFPFLYSTKGLGVRLQITGVSALSPSPHPLTPQRSCPTATCFEP